MKIPLDYSFDTHFIYVDQCHKTTLNIVVRAIANRVFSSSQIQTAINQLIKRHPYLASTVKENAPQKAMESFYLETLNSDIISTNMRSVGGDELSRIMQNPSPMREHRFDLLNGEVAHIEWIQDSNSTFIELSCPHLIGDVTAIVLLFSDLIKYLDQAVSGHLADIQPQSRVIYDEARYGWASTNQPVTDLPFPEGHTFNDSLWPEPPSSYKRGQLSIEKISNIKEWLNRNNIEGKITDVFYYVLEYLYTKKYNQNLNFSAIFSFRHLFNKAEDITNINSSAIFAMLDVSKTLLDSPKEWIENCRKIRNQAIQKEGIMEMMHFLRCLNHSMLTRDTRNKRALINAYIPINSFFAINNFGLIDQHIKPPKNFKIMDIDIQDGVPTPEVRIFGYGDTLHINPMLDPENQISAGTLLTDFSNTLTQLIRT